MKDVKVRQKLPRLGADQEDAKNKDSKKKTHQIETDLAEDNLKDLDPCPDTTGKENGSRPLSNRELNPQPVR